MSTPSQARPDRDVASRLVSRLMDPQIPRTTLYNAAWISDLMAAREPNYLRRIYWDDILRDVRRFRSQARFCKEHGLPILCIEPNSGQPPIPVALDPGTLTKALHVSQERSFANLVRELEDLIREKLLIREALTGHSAAEATTFFKDNLTDFLGTRLSAAKTRSSGGGGGGSGLPSGGRRYKFEVETRSHGLRVYWTPAAILRGGNVFGFPSTPVQGLLPPGKYCFGAGLPKAVPIYEMKAHYDVPATDHAYLDI